MPDMTKFYLSAVPGWYGLESTCRDCGKMIGMLHGNQRVYRFHHAILPMRSGEYEYFCTDCYLGREEDYKNDAAPRRLGYCYEEENLRLELPRRVALRIMPSVAASRSV